MAVYIFVAISTTLFAWSAEKAKSRHARFVFLCMIIIIFCFFAAFRDIKVGTDTSNYGLPTFQGALHHSLFVFTDPEVYSNWGFLYKVIAWFASNVFGSFQAFLFAIEMCACIPVVFAGRKLAGKNFPILIALYAIFFYPYSFNLIRQSVAMSFLLPAIYALEKNRRRLFLIWIIIGYLFHSSAVVGLLLLPFYAATKSGKLSFATKAVLISGASLAAIAAAPTTLNLMAHLLPHYSAYLDGGSQIIGGHGYRNTIEMFFGFVSVLLLWLLFRPKGGVQLDSVLIRRIEVSILLVCFGVIVTAVSVYSISMGRLGLYFFLFFILLVPSCVEAIPGSKERLFLSAFAVIILAFISIDTFVVTGQGEVFPYVFGL